MGDSIPASDLPADVVEMAKKTMQLAKFPMLATVDPRGHPRARPISPVRTEGFTVYVANLRSYGKTAEIASEPRVELVYLAPDHNQVRISGTAEVLTDADLIKEIWDGNALLRKYLGSPDNLELIIYKVVPERVRFMVEWALQYHEIPLPGS
jgi:general stress protein 26